MSRRILLMRNRQVTAIFVGGRLWEEIPSIRLRECLQKIMKLRGCKNFEVFKIDLKVEWKNMEEEWQDCVDPKHEKLCVVKEAICCTNNRYLSKQEKKKKSS